MVFEEIINTMRLQRRPLYALVLGLVYTPIAFFTAFVFFRETMSIAMIFLISLLAVPSLILLLSVEETRERQEGARNFFHNHKDIFEVYLFLFVGIFISYLTTLWITGMYGLPLESVSGEQLNVIGEIISEAVSLARGIVTGQIADTSIDYIPIDDPQVAFFSQGARLITGATSGSTATSSADAASGPATSTWFTNSTTPTIAFTHTLADIDDDTTNENYGIVINCQDNPLTEVYEWCKFATRNGETTNDLDGINGENYIGAEVYIKFSAETNPFSEGDDVVQETTGATGIVISYSTVYAS